MCWPPCGRRLASPRRRTSCCSRTSWRQAATAPASAPRSASRSPCSARRPRPAPGASALKGHHLTQSVAVRDGRIVSVTPSAFSALPNRVKSGRHAGLNTLKDEEALARRLVGDLAPPLQGRARIADRALGNILSYAGRERANAKKVGRCRRAADRGAARSAVAVDRDLRRRASAAVARRLRSARVCGPATATPFISPGTARIRPSARSATASSATAS